MTSILSETAMMSIQTKTAMRSILQLTLDKCVHLHQSKCREIQSILSCQFKQWGLQVKSLCKRSKWLQREENLNRILWSKRWTFIKTPLSLVNQQEWLNKTSPHKNLLKEDRWNSIKKTSIFKTKAFLIPHYLHNECTSIKLSSKSLKNMEISQPENLSRSYHDLNTKYELAIALQKKEESKDLISNIQLSKPLLQEGIAHELLMNMICQVRNTSDLPING